MRVVGKILAVVAVFGVFCTPLSGISEDSKLPKKFYEQDYARGAEDASGSGAKQKKSSVKSDSKKPVKTTKSDGKTNIMEASASAAEEARGKKVLSLGVVVTSNEPEHFHKTLFTLKDKAVKLEVPIGELITVGGFKEEFPEGMITALTVMGAEFVITYDTSKFYKNIEKSPTWVIQTEEGKILLEGVEKIDKFFNSKGEFVQRK